MSSKRVVTADKHTLWHYATVVLSTLVKSLLGSFVWMAIAGVGILIYQTKKSPYDLIIGIPLILAGAGLTLNNFGSLVLTIFSPKYNKGVCRLCS